MVKQSAKTATPRLRFPEFRGAEGWPVSLLGSTATFEKGRGVSKAEVDPNGGRFCIRYGELYTRYGEVIHEVFSKTNAAESTLFFSRKNDVVVPASGETKEDIATASCVLRDGIALGSDLNVIRSPHNGVFLSYLLNGSKRRELAKVAQGDTVVHLYPRQIAALSVALPESSEQQKIADCLASLDEVIAAQGRKVEALKTHKRGLMQQLFPREGETRPRLRFPEFRDAPEWRVDPLSRYIQTLDAGVSVNSGDRPALEKEVGILKTSCVTDGVFDPSENKVVLDAHELRRVKEPVRANTIIISRMNTIALVGANAFVERDMPSLFLPDRLWAAKATGKGHPRFLAYVLGSDQGRAALSELAAGSSGTMKNIGKTDVLALKISAPVAAEQRRIADFLASLDTQITAESNQLAALKTHKQGLMQQLFPGSEAVVA